MTEERPLKRYTTLAGAMDMLVEKRLALLDPAKWKDTNDTRFLSAFREAVGAKSVYAACFTQQPETYHHWQVFAGDNEGVCVEFDKEALLRSLGDDDSYLWKDVEYKTLRELRQLETINVFDLPFFKRQGYVDEQEFRLLHFADTAQSGVHCIPIRSTWIKRIIINPWLNKALYKSMKLTLQSIPGCSNVTVSHTTLIDSASWKTACDRIERRKMIKRRPSRSVT